MNPTRLLLSAAFLFITIFSNAQQVTGYFDASLSEAGTRINQVDFSKMTDFIYGFIQPDNSGNLPDPTTLPHFNTVKTKCAANGVKLHFSSGGGTWAIKQTIAAIAANSTATANFAKQIADIIQTHGLAGFDLDWEFPATNQLTDHVNLVKAINDEFVSRGKRADWQIAIAVGGETPSVGPQGVYHTDYCSPNVFQYIDHLNIMAYDVGYNISGNDPNHSSYADAVNNITDWVAKGCPISKVVLGVPFYARHETSRGVTIYNHTYGNLSSGNPAAAYTADNVGSYYYNGQPTLKKKVDYIMQQGGAGVMIWEITYDRFDQYSLLNALADAMSPYQCAAPKPDLGTDQSICGVGSITLDGGVAKKSGRTFTWKKGNTTVVNKDANANTYNATSADTYTLEVWEGGCNQSDDITITGTLNTPDLGGPYELCSPVSVTLSSGVNTNGKTIEWQKNNQTISGETGANYTAKQAGTYKIIVSASGCGSVNASATVTSKVPYADDYVVCKAGDQANLVASESVNWYSSSSSNTVLSTGTTYNPTINSNTTYWIEGSGAGSTSYQTLKSSFGNAGWQTTSQVYATKLVVSSTITIDAVTVNAKGGAVKINLVKSDGTTVEKTKSFSSVTGEQELTLSWTGIAAGTYYLNAVGSTSDLYVDPTVEASDYTINGVLTIEKACYEDWSAPNGDAYQKSTNYGNFIKLKITAGSACDRVPVSVTIDANDPNCNITSSGNIDDKRISIYPNPSSSNFILTGIDNAFIQIFDGNGKMISNFNSSSNVEFGDKFNAGIYWVRVTQNNQIKTIKVIKTK